MTSFYIRTVPHQYKKTEDVPVRQLSRHGSFNRFKGKLLLFSAGLQFLTGYVKK